MTEDQVLIKLRTMLTIEVNVEQLSVPERLRDAMDEVQSGHLLVANLWIQAHHV